MPQFDPVTFPSQVFWLAVTFVILYALMSRLVLPRITGVLEQRASRIAGDLDRAETLRRESETVLRDYEAGLARAREEANAVLAQASRRIAETAAAREKELAAELARRTEAAERRIAEARAAAEAQIRAIAINVAGDIAAKLTGTLPPEAEAAASVDRVLRR